jgi:acetyl-CoA synthetase
MTSFRQAREVLLRSRTDYDAAVTDFRWPDAATFNWGLEWFDAVLARDAASRDRDALIVIDAATGSEQRRSFNELSRRSNQVANYFRSLGIGRGDRMLILLGNVVPLWEIMLAAIKLGAVVVPAAPLLTADELLDRIDRAQVKLAVSSPDQVAKFDALAPRDFVKVLVGAAHPGWNEYAAATGLPETFTPNDATNAADPMLLYFTSGTTSKPKMVLHTHQSYPVGHLSTMYWLGLREGDVHFNISSPGWAKHAWSCFFAPWNAGATVFIYNQARFDAAATLRAVERYRVTTMCAPPTAWRTMILEDLASHSMSLRELTSAGEPLNPEVIERVKHAWGVTIREGFGQTESTAILGNPPGQPVKYGSMGRSLPGYRVQLLDGEGRESDEGELHVVLQPPPTGLMTGYAEDPERSAKALGGSHYGTGDVAFRDSDGYFWFVGRTDDVFKSSDYRISPFELESVLVEHPLIVEAAVVPAPDEVRLCIPKAYLTLRSGTLASREVASSVFKHLNARLAPFKRVRRIEFVAELPKTISGKIRRVQLRQQEIESASIQVRRPAEYREDEVKELRVER